MPRKSAASSLRFQAVIDTFQRIVGFVKSHPYEMLALFAILLMAAFLRLYNIRDTIIFLGDEGRDALVVKRIVYDGKLTLLGPTASVGGFYLGPIYYYFMIPFMLLFGMDPVGAAVMVALMGIATVALLYYLVREWFGVFPALIVSLLYSTSPGIIAFSRSSWNPNPMPLFALIMLACAWKAVSKKSWYWAFAAGISFGIIVQLHYLGLILAGVLGGITLLQSEPRNWFKLVLAEFFGFLAGASLYFGFELRHNFLNIRAVYEFITRSGGAAGPRSYNPFWLLFEVNRFNLEAVIGEWSTFLTRPITLIFFVVIIGSIWWRYKHKTLNRSSQLISVLLYWGIATLGLSLYKGQLHYHYFQLLFPAPFLLLAWALAAFKEKTTRYLIGAIAIVLSLAMVPQANTWEQGSRLLDQTERISKEVIELSDGEPYNFALITDGNSDHAYRFFLEIHNARPVPLEESVTQQLLIVCEKWPEDTCAPLGNPLWEVAGFGRAEVQEQKYVHPNTTIYKLIHHPDSAQTVGEPAPRG